MLRSLVHGGPDDEGTYTDDRVALGHRRLSIIDLTSAGHQPMIAQSPEVIISYNGEIYNYLSLKNELVALGVLFHTETDTEVVLKGFQQWGVSLFDRLEGIFAIALYDKANKLFYLIRDHLGIKPIYYFLNDKELIFSSEVKAFRALDPLWKENEDWKVLFLAFGSIPHPYTTLAGVLQVAAGSYLVLDLNDFSHKTNFYYKFNSENYTVKSSDEALAMIGSASRDSIRKNLVADAPLGIFLSGGIDSSLITLLADQTQSNIRTISVNFDEASYDEKPFQQMVLNKTSNVVHITHRVTEQTFWTQLDDIWDAMDQPSIDGVNTYFTTRCAKEDGLKVALSGIGADEIFGGYASFRRIQWMRLFRQLPFKKLIARFARMIKKSWGRLIYLTMPGETGDYLSLRGIFTPSEIASLLNISISKVWDVLQGIPREHPAIMSDKEYASFLEAKFYLNNQLIKDTDFMGMWHAVEVRAPFLDIALVKKVHSIPPALRYNDISPKYLLTVSNKGILPHEIVFRVKKGFTFPFAIWIKKGAEKFNQLLPIGPEVDNVRADFEKGRCHWSKYWSLAVMKQFK